MSESTVAIKQVMKAISILGVLIFAFVCSPVSRADVSGVFSFGWNQYGQTGVGSLDSTLVATPLDNRMFAGTAIADLVGGDRHSMLLGDDGTVYSMGSSSFGQTGLGTDVGDAQAATPIDTAGLTGKRITGISAGGFHSLLLAEDGTVLSLGYNYSGRTGLGTFVGNALTATPIVASNLENKVIAQVAGGISHSLIRAVDGTVFSFGWNNQGRTGQGVGYGDTFIATPIDATNLEGKVISRIAAGGYHSLLLASDGEVFSFGRNLNGPTGVGTRAHDSLVATRIDQTNLVGKRIVQIAAGNDHSLILADDGTVFSFGTNEMGQTGLGTTGGATVVPTPINMTNLVGKTIVQIAAGYESSLLLADDGTVFSFGSNQFGQTGLGIDSGNTAIATPIDTKNLMGRRVTQISAGGYHYFLTTVPEPDAAMLLIMAGCALLRERTFRRARLSATRKSERLAQSETPAVEF